MIQLKTCEMRPHKRLPPGQTIIKYPRNMEFAEAQDVWSNMHKTSRGSELSGEHDGLDEDSLEVFQAAASEVANLGRAYGRVVLQDSDAGAFPASKQGQDNSPGLPDTAV